ncbi:MAG: methyltransferase domain-containing protein [Deltaproteobacteria bacterium]|nr:methyltransferase domain-containing protein [Deltaproteobacteria bacterium]
MSASSTLESVKAYYGKVLSSNKDLQTSACCTAEAMPPHLRELLKDVHEEVQDKFYGCGSPIPSELEGRTVLDLGSGSGRDCYLLSRLVGARGRVIGVDMTAEQLEVARRHVGWHTAKYGYATPNVEFKQGYIEDLEGAGVASSSIDVVVSNCVVNLSPDKRRVFSEVLRVLKPGGELIFSDVFADRRLADAHRKDPVLLGECLGGALYMEDFRRTLLELGCRDYRVVSSSPLALGNADIERKVGNVTFTSRTIRAFKLDLEDRCEDYGQVAWYQGTIPEAPHGFVLDDHHHFKTGQPHLVCSNTAAMLADTRYARHFKVLGDTSTHYGLFDCTPEDQAAPSSGACC